jgi:hypothetical protein
VVDLCMKSSHNPWDLDRVGVMLIDDVVGARSEMAAIVRDGFVPTGPGITEPSMGICKDSLILLDFRCRLCAEEILTRLMAHGASLLKRIVRR